MLKKTFKNIKRQLDWLSYILEKKHKRKLPRLFLCIFFSSLFELLGVTAILPFVYAMIDIDTVRNNAYAKPVFDFFGVTSDKGVLYFIGIGIIILYIIKNAFLVFSVTYRAVFSTRVEKELKVKMLHSYLERSYEFFLDTTAGEIMRGCLEDTAAVYSSVSTIFDLVMSLLTSIMIGIYMIVADPLIALGTLLVAAVCVVMLTKVFRPIMRRLSEKSMVTSRKMNDSLNQTIYGIKELMVMGRQDLFVKTFDKASEDRRKITIRSTFVNTLPNRTIEAFFIMGFLGVILLKIATGSDYTASVPTLASFAVGAFKVLPYISSITNKVNTLDYNLNYVENVYNNMKDAEAYQVQLDEYSLLHGGEGSRQEDDPSVVFKDILEISDVTWQYSKGVKPVLEKTSMYVKKGEAVGFIGASGSGKTTLADVILGLLQPKKGGVFMDGLDVYTMPRTWSRIIGYVPQSVFLLAGTIRDNVAFGKKDFSDEEIMDALDRAQLSEFVRNLPDGLDTEVGERGVKLSGGQRQRIAIARALANEPMILVLDEATSALDNETESAIMESIDALQGQITMIIVAHRLTTIKNCNRIYRIGNGVATEVSHEEVFGDKD